MPKGGTREGAGRPRGSPNKASAAKAKAVAESGLTPLDYMLGVMRDRTVDYERRDRMAAAVAPYIHPRLTAITPPTEGSGRLTITWKNG